MKGQIRLPEHFIQRENLRAGVYVAVNLAVVLGAGIIAWHIGTWWAFLIAFFLVGARGQAAYILQHEAMHNLLFSSPKANEKTGVLLSSVLGTQFFMGRAMHWAHHREVGASGDPNEIYHNVEDRPPGAAALRFFAFHLLGGRLIMLVANLLKATTGLAILPPMTQAAPPPRLPKGKVRIDLLSLFGAQLVVFVSISLLSSPLVYLALYILPLSTLTAFFEALRSFSEHVLPGTARGEAEERRQFFMDAGPVERFCIGQFDFHYHHVHHIHANVPTFKVRALHEWLLQNDPSYPNQFKTRPGYVGTALRYLLNQPFNGAGAGYPAIAPGSVHARTEEQRP